MAMRKTASKARRVVREDEQTVTPSSGNVFADLGQDVRIVVHPKPCSRSRATLRATVGVD
jgi:hypothetical protein